MANLLLESTGRLLRIAVACLMAAQAHAAAVHDTVPGERLARVARERLQAALQRAGMPASAGAAQLPPDVAVPAGRVDLQAREPMTTGLRGTVPQRRTVWVEVRVDGRLVRTVAVGVDVVPGSAAPVVSAEPVPAGGAAVARGLAVTRGGSAVLHLSDGAIELDSVVRVLQDGALGDQVRVRPANAGADIVARVVGVGRLEVAP